MTWRGGEQQLAYLAEELEKIDHCHNAIFCAENGALAHWAKQHNIPAYEAKEMFAVNPVFASKLSKAYKKGGFDLVHVHDSHAHTFAVLANVFFRMGAPLIVSRRVDFPVSKSVLSRFKYNHHSVKKIVCVSDAIQRITGASIKDKSVLTTVHSGIDASKFKNSKKNGKLHLELGLEPTLSLVGNVAALAPHKDYFTFIETCKELMNQGLKAKFIIVGSGPEEDSVKKWVEESGIAEHILMLGFRDDLIDILPELDVFLITSQTEGLGTSILDAFACKVPVVATDAGGIPEIVLHRKTGWLGKVKQPKALAEGVIALLRNDALRKSTVSGATQKLQDFTKQATAQKTYKVYRTVVK